MSKMKLSAAILTILILASTLSFTFVVQVAAPVVSSILFEDDFELIWSPQTAGDLGGGVVTPGGEWKVVDDGTGNFAFQAKSAGGYRGTATFAGDTSWTDYTVEARIRTTDSYWGLIVLADSTGTTFYSAYINTVGDAAEIWKHSNGIWGRTKLVKNTGKSPSVSPNTWYDIKVEVSTTASGKLIKLFYKTTAGSYPATPQAEYEDTSPYSSGQVGLIFYDDASNGVAWFDDVVVSGSILLSDNFDDYFGKWQHVSGTPSIVFDEIDSSRTNVLSIVGGSYVGEVSMVTGCYDWKDYIFELDVKKESGDYFNIVFRYQDNAHHYLLEPSADQVHIALFKKDGGGYIELTTSRPLQDTTAGTWYHYRFEVRTTASGTDIKIYVDDVLKFDVDDNTPSIATGCIGVGGYSGSEGRFDNVVVRLCANALQFVTPPSDSIVAIDNPATLKVLVTDSDSNGVEGVEIQFSSDPAGLTFAPTAPTTDQNGEATVMAETGNAGIYVVTATACGSISDTWTLVVFDPKGMTAGGGWYITEPDADTVGVVSGARASFGFVAKYAKGKSTGNLEFQYHVEDRINLKSTSITWLVVSGSNAQFKGAATVNGETGYYFRVIAMDLGEPGVGSDSFSIKIWFGDPDTDGTLIHSSHDTLSGGNIMVRTKNK